MKQTKNMIYKKSEESRELYLFCDNTKEVYNYSLKVIEMLAKKYKKGAFEIDKAALAFYRVADFGSKLYNKYYGYTFTVTERYTAAVELLDSYMEHIDGSNPV